MTDRLKELADHIETAEKALLWANDRITQLEAALKPFEAIADWYGDCEDDEFEVQHDWPHGWSFAKGALALKHFRKARAALHQGDRKP